MKIKCHNTLGSQTTHRQTTYHDNSQILQRNCNVLLKTKTICKNKNGGLYRALGPELIPVYSQPEDDF